MNGYGQSGLFGGFFCQAGLAWLVLVAVSQLVYAPSLGSFHFLDVQMFAVWDISHHSILLFRRYAALHVYKRLSQYARRLVSSTNFQGLTDLLYHVLSLMSHT